MAQGPRLRHCRDLRLVFEAQRAQLPSKDAILGTKLASIISAALAYPPPFPSRKIKCEVTLFGGTKQVISACDWPCIPKLISPRALAVARRASILRIGSGVQSNVRRKPSSYLRKSAPKAISDQSLGYFPRIPEFPSPLANHAPGAAGYRKRQAVSRQSGEGFGTRVFKRLNQERDYLASLARKRSSGTRQSV